MLTAMYPFKRLSVWEKSHELTVLAYRATEQPTARRFPLLVTQLRRAVAAIPANIAEGAGHASQAQFARYLEIAIATSREAQYHILLARDLGALAERDFATLEARASQVQGMLVSLRKRVVQRAREKGKRGGRTASPPSPFTVHPTVTAKTTAPKPTTPPTSA